MCVACGCSKEYQKVTSGLRFHRSGLPILRDVAHASPIWATAPHSTLVKHGLLKVDLLRTHVLLRRLLVSILVQKIWLTWSANSMTLYARKLPRFKPGSSSLISLRIHS